MKKILSILFFLFISITAFSQQTMYWFGGAGNWNDLSHWSFQSGGGVHPVLGLPSSIPTSDTHVIFDANSGLNGTGTTAPLLAARTVTLNSEVVIKSLTFDSSLAPHSPRIANNFHIRVTEDVIMQPNVTLTSASYAIVMEPLVSTITTLTLNGANIPYFSKGGAGDLNIVGTINSGRYIFQSGINNYTAATARFAGNNSISFRVNNAAVLNMPNVTLLETNNPVNIDGTAQFNAPLLTTWAGIGTNFSDLGIGGTVNLDLPSLQIWNLKTMVGGTATSSVTIPNGTIVTTTGNWLYIGTLNAGTSEFHIQGTQFSSKNGTVINKVFMEQAVPTTAASVTGISTINELHFVASNGTLSSNMTIGKLYLAPSRSYSIYRNSAITITENIIDSTPDCVPFYSISSNDINYIARINNASGNPINLKNVSMARINVIAGVINAEGIDAANNATIGTTLNFIEPAAKTLYWVGDAGDDEWNNELNWSGTSGGTGGYCLPTRYDNVIFDDNSVVLGSTLKITNNSAAFHDITIQDNFPKTTLTFGNSTINMICTGSWYMKSGLYISSPAYFVTKDMGETITSNTSTFRIVYFQGIGGWTLQDKFQIASDKLRFDSGTLNTNSQEVYVAGDFEGHNALNPTVANGGYRSLILGSSQISVAARWYYQGAGNLLDAGTSHITLRNGATFSALNGHVYYNVTSNATGTGTLGMSGNATYNIINIYNKTADIQNTIVAKELHAMTPSTLGRLNLVFRQSATFDILELQSNAIMQAANNTTITANDQFITHTDDCQGLMEMNVIGKTAGQKFNFKALNNTHVPNVWMTGVNADLSTGATYTATGLEDTDVTNWTFQTPAAKELYWIGIADNNWNNGLNWTTNTNGTPSPGGCVPTKYDNVHFNSFSTGNLPIHILDQPAYFNNLIAHNDAPAGINITYPSGLIMEAYSYGNLIQMGEDMYIVRLNLLGNHTDGQLINKGASWFSYLRVNNPTANWTFTGNMRTPNEYIQTGATVTVNGDTWAGNIFTINGEALNLNMQTVTGSTFTLTKGALKASDLTMTLTGSFNSNGNNAVTTARSVDIRNSIINVAVDWFYYNLAGATLQAENSSITYGRNFYGRTGHEYNVIETGTNASYSTSTHYLRGGIKANKVVFNQTKALLDNNTIGTLFVKPRGLTLFVGTNTTQTVTDHLYISGTPCLTNVVRAGTETGSTQASATATINYTNANPTVANEDNTFDYLRVGGINASNSKLFLQVNATQLGLNTNVESIAGTPGLIGLGADISCQEIIDTDPATYTITAEKFYAGPEATFVWYKKIGGVYQNLNLPLDTREIDVRNFGFDGDYKVDILYDPLHPTVALRCPQIDEITVSYKPKNVVVDAGKEHYQFCGDSNGMQVSDFEISMTTQTEMTTRGAEIKWYPTVTGGTAFNATDIVVAGNYYAELVVSNTNCVSPARTLVTVGIDAAVTADAGPGQTKSNNYPVPFTMAANNPAVGTGNWVIISGDVTITNTALYNTTVTLNSGSSAELQWVVTNGACTASDNVVLSKLSTSPRVNPSLRMRVSQ